jgi:phenylpyruvate tautomerase PptA (4-oxalocrotonate tautomerase family)
MYADCSGFCLGRNNSWNKKKTVEVITKVFEDMGVPKEAVHIIIYETQKTNWATSGKLHSEKHTQPPSL